MQADLRGKRIMVAVLNWGLGHATRSVPIIQRLLKEGVEVFLSGDGPPLQYLKEAFPNLEAFELPAYNIRYPSGLGGAWKTVLQAPYIIRAIREERVVVAELSERLGLDAIISDNRYGAHADNAVSIFMCHQLRVLPPKGFRWGAPVIFRWHKSFFSRFDQIWVPDFPGEENLSGILSHGLDTGMPTHFIGPQSRFALKEPFEIQDEMVLALLSGPEPQRSIFEELLWKQLPLLDLPVVLVRGVVEVTPIKEEGSVKTISFVQQEELSALMESASFIICRPGYSTIMDVSNFRKKVLLIPTPGQTEQEYLAETLAEMGRAVVQRQGKMNLKQAVRELERIEPLPAIQHDDGLLDKALEALSEAINMRTPLKR